MIYGLMDKAFADAVGVAVETWIDVIEHACTFDEAEFIIDNIWNETAKLDEAKQLFLSKIPKSK